MWVLLRNSPSGIPPADGNTVIPNILAGEFLIYGQSVANILAEGFLIYGQVGCQYMGKSVAYIWACRFPIYGRATAGRICASPQGASRWQKLRERHIHVSDSMGMEHEYEERRGRGQKHFIINSGLPMIEATQDFVERTSSTCA